MYIAHQPLQSKWGCLLKKMQTVTGLSVIWWREKGILRILYRCFSWTFIKNLVILLIEYFGTQNTLGGFGSLVRRIYHFLLLNLQSSISVVDLCFKSNLSLSCGFFIGHFNISFSKWLLERLFSQNRKNLPGENNCSVMGKNLSFVKFPKRGRRISVFSCALSSYRKCMVLP